MQKEEVIILSCAIIFLASGTLFLFSILISRIVKTQRNLTFLKLRDVFQKRLNAFIIQESSGATANSFSWQYNLNELRKQLPNAYRKQLLLDLLITNKQNLSGSAASTLRKVYLRLGLKKVSRAKLYRYNSIKKIQGLHELAAFECKDVLPEIKALFNHRKRSVREESLVAMIRLLGAAPFALLRGYTGTISPWMQLTIHKYLATLPSDRLPKFSHWFTSDNKAIKKFAIAMVCQFKQYKAIPRLAVLLKDEDVEIGGLAASVLGNMGASEYADEIAELGKRQITNDSVSLSVIKALAQIGNPEKHNAFLGWQMIHGSYAIRVEAMRALHQLKMSIHDFLIDFNTENDQQFDRIYRHITNPLLQ